MARTKGQILARWRASLHDVDCTPLEFFALVREGVEASELPGLSFSEITRAEGGLFSPGRIYFRIRCDRLFFDISAFVAGRALAISYWLHEDLPGVRELFSEIPPLGFLIESVIKPATYYKVDLLETFQHAVHDAIIGIFDELSQRNGAPLLPDDLRQPIWEEVW